MRNLKSVIAAGGLGTRLQNFRGNESTKILLDVLGVPMIVHQINQLRKWGCSEFVLITNPDFGNLIEEVTTKAFPNLDFKFAIQNEPKGISHALKQSSNFINDNEKILFILGDNFFEHNPLENFDQNEFEKGAIIFTKSVKNPEEFGVAQMDLDGNVISIEEKPNNPKSNYAVSGLYFYPNDVINIAKAQKPSSRGELEITDVNKTYLDRKRLIVERMGRGYTWLDTGTHESLLQASQYVQMIEQRQGLKIGCIEEVAWRMGFISTEQLKALAEPLCKSGYGNYLLDQI